jgi:hypothetical protein
VAIFLIYQLFINNDSIANGHKKRQNIIQCNCKNINDVENNLSDYSLFLNKGSNMIYNLNYNLFICGTQNTGLLSWKRVIYQLTKDNYVVNSTIINSSEDYYKRFSDVSSKDRNFYLDMLTKVLMVRNPLDRILSIYLEHFENPKHYDKRFHDKFDYWIKFLNRNDTMDTESWDRNITFEEFIKFIANTDESRFHYNTLWDEIYEVCMPCTIKYDIIIRYENLLEDSNFVLKTIGVSDKISFPNEEQYLTDLTIFKKYFANLNKNTRQKLRSVYKKDFILQYGLI